MASKCTGCGEVSFPPRADCEHCMKGEFEFMEISGNATLHTYTQIVAAPVGFEDKAPYFVGLADLEEGGRVLAIFNDSIEEKDIKINMKLKVVPVVNEEPENRKVYYNFVSPE